MQRQPQRLETGGAEVVDHPAKVERASFARGTLSLRRPSG
jgi:hypothetical protein